MASAEALADTAVSITDLVGGLARFGNSALPVAEFIAGFFPGAAPALQVIRIAAPILAKIAIAAPIVATAINKGRPIFDAMEQASPGLLPSIKELYAIAVNHDPARAETDVTATSIDDVDVLGFASSIFAMSYFTPQDNRFQHGAEH